MSDEDVSTDILKRLQGLPPYGKANETPPVVEPTETPVEEPAEQEKEEVETPIETKPEETPAPVEEDVEEEVTEEEALSNSKNPERTKKYIESLKAKIPAPAPVVEEPKEHIPNAFEATEPEALAGMDTPVETPQFTPQEVANTQVFPNLSQKKIDDIMASLVATNEDGEEVVDIDKLRATLAQANMEVQNAKSESQKAIDRVEKVEKKFSDFEKTKEVVKVHESFPELDPESGKFDPKFYEVVKNEMVQQLIQKGKKDFMAAAEKYQDIFRKGDDEVNKKEKAKQTEVVNAKKQINATGSHVNAQQRKGWEDPTALAAATRTNQKGALEERLRRSGN